MAIALGPATTNLVANLGQPTNNVVAVKLGQPASPIAGVGPVANGNAYSAAVNTAQHPAVAAPAAAPGAGSAFNAPGYIGGITQEYGASIGGAQNLLQENVNNLPVQQALVNQQYGANANEINANAAGSINTLETQKSGVQTQQGLSLAELADQIHGQNQGLLTSLGTAGAGSSSAVGAGQNALAKVQNAGRADINTQAGTNVATIGAEEQAVNDQQKTQIQALDAWKQSQIQSILQNYMQITTTLQQQIGTAQGEEKARLAEYGQATTTAAGQALTELDSQVKGQVNNIMNAQVSTAPTITAPAAYTAPSAITVPSASPFSSGAATSNATAAPTGGSLAALTGKLSS